MPLENLVVVSGSENSDFDFEEPKERDIRFYLNIWNSSKPNKPNTVAVPYRGGYRAGDGLNDVRLEGRYLFVADNEGILCYDINNLLQGYTELGGVHEVSALLCKTSKYLISGAMKWVQIRRLDKISKQLKNSDFSNGQVEMPFDELAYDSEGDTFLSMMGFGSEGQEKIILNTASDKSYLIDPESRKVEQMKVIDGLFPNTFQRRSKYHFIKNGDNSYLIFTEYSKEDQSHDIRVYSLSLATSSPSIKEIRSFENEEIISMLLPPNEEMKILWKNRMQSYLETMDPISFAEGKEKRIQQRGLKKSYHLGDRLQEVDGQLLIVRHEEDEIVDAVTEESIKFTGAVNDLAIPEISSIWENPQFLYVAKVS